MKEFKVEINKRNTIIKYDNNVDIKELLIQVSRYKKTNRWKLKTYLIKNNNYIIVDEEYKIFRDNNKDKDMFYVDNQVYEIVKPFKPKGRIRRIIERIFNR